MASSTGIGQLNEFSLHATIKKWYAEPGDLVESRVDGYFVDLVRNGRLIEVQTKNFASIKPKLMTLIERHSIQLVYPISREKWIRKFSPDMQKEISRRKSPKKGTLYHLFDELIRFPELMKHPHFELTVLFIIEEELRCLDGRGSWRRKGERIVDRRLSEVLEAIVLRTPDDFYRFIPTGISMPFSNKMLAESIPLAIKKVRKMTYCLRKMEIIQEVGKRGNQLLFSVPSIHQNYR